MNIHWDSEEQLLPAIIQNADTGQVLMLGYMNQTALVQTQATGRVTFYSRKRKTLWVKGETSGHFLNVVDMMVDCDNDTLLILVKPVGSTCHTGATSCFPKSTGEWSIISELEAVIKQRQNTLPDKSYTATLFNAGITKIAQKVGEEGVEIVIAALSESDARLQNEVADLLYHLLVLLRARNISFASVLQILKARAH